MLCLRAVACVLFASAVAGQSGTLLDGTSLSDDVCFTSVPDRLSVRTVTVTQPSTRTLLMPLPTAPRIVLSCFHAIVRSVIPDDEVCNQAGQVYLCNAAVGSVQFTCELLTEYNLAQRVRVARGDPNDSEKQWQLEWSAGARPGRCFGMSVQGIATVGTEDVTSSIWIFIVAVLVVLLVAALVAAFVVHKFRKTEARRASEAGQLKEVGTYNSPREAEIQNFDDLRGATAPVPPGMDSFRGPGPETALEVLPPQPLPMAEMREWYLSRAEEGPDPANDSDPEQQGESVAAMAADLARTPSLYAKSLQRAEAEGLASPNPLPPRGLQPWSPDGPGSPGSVRKRRPVQPSL